MNYVIDFTIKDPLLWCQCWLFNLANVLVIEFHPKPFSSYISNTLRNEVVNDFVTKIHKSMVWTSKKYIYIIYDTLFLIFYFLPCGLGDMVYKCKFILALSSQFFCFYWRSGGLWCRKKTWQTRMKLVSKQVDSRSQYYKKKTKFFNTFRFLSLRS